MKFYLNDLLLFYRIIYSLVSIDLPEQFTFVDGKELKYTRKTANIIDEKDITSIICSVKPTCDSFRNCFFYRTMKLWNFLPYDIRQDVTLSSFKRKLIKLLWASDTDWPD